MTVKNFCTVRPDQLKPGDVLLCVVKLMVGYYTKDGKPVYRLYQCMYPADTDCMCEEDVPQGSRVTDADLVGKALFPVVGYAGMEGE